MPISLGRSVPCWPRAGQVSCPPVGISRSAIKWRNVDLPQPEGPTMAIRSLARMVNVAGRKASISAFPCRNRRVTSIPLTRGLDIDHSSIPQMNDAVCKRGQRSAVSLDQDRDTHLSVHAQEIDEA